jgi:molecular chaperone GrpE
VADLVQRLLPALDSLDHALANAEGEVAHGLRMVRADLDKALAAEGITPLPALGQPYDPLRHEAIGRTTRPCQDGEAPGLVVGQELRRGYALKGRVLRPAMVHVVERTPPPAEPASHASQGA